MNYYNKLQLLEQREEIVQKLKSIIQKYNTIVIPKVSVRQSMYETSVQPMILITGQSRLDVI
jgi:hypothetical protein